MNQAVVDLVTKLPDPGDKVWAIVVVYAGHERIPEPISTLPEICVRRCTVDYIDIRLDKTEKPVIKVEMHCGDESVSAAPRDLFTTKAEAVETMKQRYHT